MTHAQRVVDYQELATHVFGSVSYPASSNAIGVYVQRVRRKIEPDPQQPRYIKNVRSRGYLFQATG